MSQDKKTVAETKLTEEEKLLEEKTVEFVESIAKTNTEKITKEILEGLSEDTDDSDSYDVESGGEDSEDRPWRPSHAVFGKSTIKQSHLDNMRGRYFRDMSIVRADVDRAIPAPEENEIVIYRSFFKAGLRFPLSRFVVEVLKTYQIFLHQITPWGKEQYHKNFGCYIASLLALAQATRCQDSEEVARGPDGRVVLREK
jgi:hypothetical protein